MTNFTAIKPLGHVCNFIPNFLPKVTDIEFGRMKKRVNHGAILQYEKMWTFSNINIIIFFFLSS